MIGALQEVAKEGPPMTTYTSHIWQTNFVQLPSFERTFGRGGWGVYMPVLRGLLQLLVRPSMKLVVEMRTSRFY